MHLRCQHEQSRFSPTDTSPVIRLVHGISWLQQVFEFFRNIRHERMVRQYGHEVAKPSGPDGSHYRNCCGFVCSQWTIAMAFVCGFRSAHARCHHYGSLESWLLHFLAKWRLGILRRDHVSRHCARHAGWRHIQPRPLFRCEREPRDMGTAYWSCTGSVSSGYLLPPHPIQITPTIDACLLV